MRIIKNEKLTVTSGDEREIVLSNGKEGDTTTGELYVQTMSAISFSAEGKVNAFGEAVDVPFINCADYSISTEPSAAGLYMAMATPFEKINLAFDGDSEVIIKTVF